MSLTRKGLQLTIDNELESDRAALCQEINSFFITSIEALVKLFTSSEGSEQLSEHTVDENTFYIQKNHRSLRS